MRLFLRILATFLPVNVPTAAPTVSPEIDGSSHVEPGSHVPRHRAIHCGPAPYRRRLSLSSYLLTWIALLGPQPSLESQDWRCYSDRSSHAESAVIVPLWGSNAVYLLGSSTGVFGSATTCCMVATGGPKLVENVVAGSSRHPVGAREVASRASNYLPIPDHWSASAQRHHFILFFG